MLIGAQTNVRHPPAPMCCLCYTAMIGNKSFAKIYVYVRCFDVITSFFSGYMFGAGTTAHRHTRTVIRVP